MSQVLLQEARTIGKQLSTTEKIQLIEWLSTELRQELVAAREPPEDNEQNDTNSRSNGHHTAGNTEADVSIDKLPSTWTEEEIRELMNSEPRTGAEIAAKLKQLDLSSWQEQDIPDVVEWLHEQREQSRCQRHELWDSLET